MQDSFSGNSSIVELRKNECVDFLESIPACASHLLRVGTFNFFIKKHLLPNRRICLSCRNDMKVISNDKPLFRCEQCATEFSILRGTPFESRKFHLDKFAVILVAWINNMSLKEIASSIGHDISTVSKIVWEFRSIIHSWHSTQFEKIGGLGHVVEIENSLYVKLSLQPGQESEWVVGGMDRSTGRWFLTGVVESQRWTISEAIIRYVAEGSVITFECRETKWIQIKKKIGQRYAKWGNSLREASWEMTLSEYVWRSQRSTGEELFSDVVSALNYLYDSQNKRQ